MAVTAQDRWRFLSSSLPSKRLTHVVDIGANPLDDPPYKPLLDAGLCNVFGFEPQPEAFKQLQKIKGDLETYVECAVGDGKTMGLNVYKQSGLSSLFKLDFSSIAFLGRNKAAAELQETIEVSTRRLDDIDEIQEIDLLKIDVQGAEPMIFDNGKNKLKSAVAVVTELRFYPLYEKDMLQDTQISRLAKLGLMFHKYLFVKSKMVANSQAKNLRQRRLRTQAIDGDAVFVTDLRTPDKLTDEQLSHLAILSDAVFQSFDITIRCIDILAERGRVKNTLAAEYVQMLPAELRR